MTDDPDELRYEHAIKYKNPEYATQLLEQIEVHLHYGIPSLKVIGWIIIVLLAAVVWRVWT